MDDPFTFTKHRGIWMHSIGCDWEMRERGKDCECGLVEAWEDEQAAIADIWANGHDSEAARAWRGEGTVMCPDLALLHSYAQEMERELSAFESPRPAPNPDCTPAVRRVVAWDDGGRLHTHPERAYVAAALGLIERAWTKRGSRGFAVGRYFSHGEGRCVPNERHPRVKRLARLLRLRDEKAGHR